MPLGSDQHLPARDHPGVRPEALFVVSPDADPQLTGVAESMEQVVRGESPRKTARAPGHRSAGDMDRPGDAFPAGLPGTGRTGATPRAAKRRPASPSTLPPFYLMR